VGDEVFGYCDGAFAGSVVVPAVQLLKKPAEVRFEDAAAVPIAALTALQALRDVAAVQPGQHVLVIGASGGVGTFAVQLARGFGATVTGVCSGRNADLVRSLGADDVVDYTATDPFTLPKRFDVVLDAVGNGSLSQLRKLVCPGGILLLVGSPKGTFLGGIDRMVGGMLLSLIGAPRIRAVLSLANPEDLRVLGALMAAGKVNAVIDRTFALEHTGDALRYVEAGHACGKVVIVPA
jgi:NADPH:quinone reductase-like Zn-dependent oxidoreductase